MAASHYSHSDAEQPLTSSETKTVKTSLRIPRRKVTLICITLLLNVLLWSAIICLVTSLYQIISDPQDITNVAPVVLTLTSALTTIAYTFIHTVFSLKQKTWEQQQRHTSAVKKTSYVAIRLVISLCVLWLLTTGWNMIIVARRPVCLHEAPGLEGWEFGSTCLGSRIGIAFAAISLVTSCVLFGVCIDTQEQVIRNGQPK
ncbi:hypothetical protein J4E82_005381 [Alternaria postmessia]|uniref:uncharacterized protein n=1 Tax=Alternaria postmessia TaxID=1187938 RepID=UPI002224EBAB|nr:uncharacterized protein J4E82_005381 [Alternaria postmessia]KAI5375903.1 hypothetical protein J4E82_005381 [Alternaria postmessia]